MNLTTACIYVSRVCTLQNRSLDTITGDINAKSEIWMLTILRQSLNYYKDHHTTNILLLPGISPPATINKGSIPLIPTALDYYPRKIQSITPRRPYYIDIVTAGAQTLLLVERRISPLSRFSHFSLSLSLVFFLSTIGSDNFICHSIR